MVDFVNTMYIQRWGDRSLAQGSPIVIWDYLPQMFGCSLLAKISLCHNEVFLPQEQGVKNNFAALDVGNWQD